MVKICVSVALVYLDYDIVLVEDSVDAEDPFKQDTVNHDDVGRSDEKSDCKKVTIL